MASVWIRTRATQRRRQALPRRVPARRPRVDRPATAARSRPSARRRPASLDRRRARRAARPRPARCDAVPRRRADAAPRRPSAGRPSRVDVAERRPGRSTASRSAACCRCSASRPSTRSPPPTSPRSSPRLHADGYKRETIRKTCTALAMVLDHAGVDPNPARDRATSSCRARSPRSRTRRPPSTSRPSTGCSRRSTGCRCSGSTGRAPASSVDRPTLVGDYDEPRRRVRLRAATTKTRRALWVELHPRARRRARGALGPREDRDPDARLFAGSRRRRAPHGDREGVQGGRRPAVVAARPAPPADLAAAPARRAVGADRRVRRAAQPRGHRRHVHARPLDETELDYAGLLAMAA